MDADFFADMDFETQDLPPTPVPHDKVTAADILRWSSWTRPFPLPPHLSPTEPQFFEDVPDEVFLTSPPHLIAHLHRTAAQGGLQVISPRQTPLSSLMCRSKAKERHLGDHVVGSVASDKAEWPTLDNFDFSELLPDEPLAVRSGDDVVRAKTKTEPLTRASNMLRDPILACLVKGRAVIDILERDDVGGDADGMTEILAKAWGIPKKDLMDLDAFTLGIDGPLLRHAIKSDEVYPMVHAPIHQKLCISVGSSEISRHLLPDDSAIDWRRLRVFCEAVFLLSCSVEGYPLTSIRAEPPPGDPSAPLSRKNVLAFYPAPCIAWSHEPMTFSVCPTTRDLPEKIGKIPREVLEALSQYLKLVRPISHAVSMGTRAVAKKSVLKEIGVPSGETIAHSYQILTRQVHTGGARGKNSSRAVRDLIYETIESANISMRLRLARYFYIAKSEVKIHLGLDMIPDSMVDRMARKFLRVGDLIRNKVAAECARRGCEIEDWWSDITAKTPHEYQILAEGTMGWAKVAMWLLFKAPSDKWEGLVKAMHYTALRDADFKSMSGVALPPEIGSMERVLAAAREMVKASTTAYSGYYLAVSDVAMAISDELVAMKKPRSADIVKEGAYLWVLRSRALRGTNVSAIEKDEPTPSTNHLRIVTEPVDLIIKPAPYRPFELYRSHVRSSNVLHKSIKSAIIHFEPLKISNLFRFMDKPMTVAPDSVITRYLRDPEKLANDMERAWMELANDVEKTVDIYGHGGLESNRQKRPVETQKYNLACKDLPPVITGKRARVDGKTYYELLAEMNTEQADGFEDLACKMDPAALSGFMERTYADIEDLRDAFVVAMNDIRNVSGGSQETVI